MHIKTGQLDIALGSLFADSESLPIEQRKLLDMVSINHFLINHRSDPFSDKNIRQAFGELLQSVAWKPNNIPWNQRKSTSLVPTGFFSVASSQNKLSIEKSAQALKKVRGSFKTPVKIALIGKHFSSKFLLDLEKVLINIDIPFNLINLEPSEWNLNKTSGNFDITHLPMQPSFYDPDGIFITLKNYYPENLQYLFKNMSNYRNITNKKKRIHGYVKGLRQIENAWILVPTYRKYVPYLASDEIQFPQTKFLNEIAVWKIRKSNRGINDSKDR